MTAIDLNADVGEGFGHWQLGDDEALLPLVTSVNIACGFHAGDPSIMRRVCQLAAGHNVSIGAQVGYPDLRGFGRRRIEVPVGELIDDILYQVGALKVFADAAGTTVGYLKPHGALYNTAAADPAVATAVATAAAALKLPLLGLASSRMATAAHDAQVQFVAEAFADRAYTPSGQLAARSEPGSVLTSVDDVVARCVRLSTDGVLVATDGRELAITAQSICLHGDTPSAVALAAAVRSALAEAGVAVRSFTA